MKRTAIRIALALGLVVLLSACNVSSHIVVRPDGSGTYSMIMTVPDGPENAGDKLYDAVKEAAKKSNVPMPVERIDNGDSGGAKISFEFKSLDDLKAESDRLAEVGSSLGGIAIDRGTEGWHFTAATVSGLGRQPGTPESGSPGGAIDASQLGELIDLSVVVELPGAPANNNATRVSHTDTTSEFTWELEVGREATALEAATTFVGDQGSVKLAKEMTPVRNVESGAGLGSGSLVGIGLGTMLAAALTYMFLRRRRSPTSPPPST